MSLDAILKRIHEAAGAEEAGILGEAKLQAEAVLKEAKKEADALYSEIVAREKALAEKECRSLFVNARLEAKKNILKAKQELIDEVFLKLRAAIGEKRFRKIQIFKKEEKETPEDMDFYLNKIRPDYESELAGILFK